MLKVGSFCLHMLETESFALDGGAMFGVVPKTLWSKEALADEENRIVFATRPLLIQTNGRNILVDAGIGNKGNEKFNRIYRVTGPNITAALKAIQLTPDQITDVVLTHLHFDHCGGLTRWENGKPVLLFPKARFFIQKQGIENAQNPNPREKASFLAENIDPLLESGRVEQIDGLFHLLEGIELIPQFGHTVAMQIVKITTGAETFLYICDTVPTAMHLRLAWVTAYDLMPVITMKEKTALLEQAAEQHWRILYAHDPNVQSNTIKFDGKHYAPDKIVKV